ncbi:MAG: SLC13 family permease [archaeon]
MSRDSKNHNILMPDDFFFHWLPEKLQKYTKLFIPFIVMAIFILLPLPVDQNIKKALALFLCIALLWSLEPVSIIVTSLMIPVLAIILNLTSSPFSAFSNPVIYLILSGLMIAQAFRKHGLDALVAKKIISFSGGKIRHLLFFTMLATALLGMWMSNTATLAMLIPIILTLSKKFEKHIPMLLLAAGIASSIGGMVTIVGANPNAITAAYLSERGSFTFIDWMKIGLPIAIVIFWISYYVIKWIYKVDDEELSLTEKTSDKMTYGQKKLLAIFLPTVLLWLLGSFILPERLARPDIIGLSCALFMFGFHVLEWDDVRKISWEIFLLIGGGLTLGQILMKTGTASLIASKLLQIFGGGHPYIILVAIIILSIVLSNFINNSSTAIILVPVFLDLANSIGIDYRIVAMTVAFATGISAMTPIAMPSFAMIYGTGKVKRKEMIRLGMAMALICTPVLAFMLFLSNVFK